MVLKLYEILAVVIDDVQFRVILGNLEEICGKATRGMQRWHIEADGTGLQYAMVCHSRTCAN